MRNLPTYSHPINPFGETSFGSYEKKRYRFTGKERDSESGLYYYGARYYAPWTCRFISVDPLAGKYPNINPYIYAFNNPLAFNDPTGMEGEKASADNISSDGGDTGSGDGGGNDTTSTPQPSGIEIDVSLLPKEVNTNETPYVDGSGRTGLIDNKATFNEDKTQVTAQSGQTFSNIKDIGLISENALNADYSSDLGNEKAGGSSDILSRGNDDLGQGGDVSDNRGSNWERDLGWTSGNLTIPIVDQAASLAGLAKASKFLGPAGSVLSASVSLYDYSKTSTQTLQQRTAANRQLTANLVFTGIGLSAPAWSPFAPIPITLSIGFAIGDASGLFDPLYKY